MKMHQFIADLHVQLSREHTERKSAGKLAQEVRRKYGKYIGECCRECVSFPEPASSPEPRTSMDFSTPRSITSCRIGRREPMPGFPQIPNYEDYIFFADHPQEGSLELQEVHRKDKWASTRSIIVTLGQSSHSVEGQLEGQCRLPDLH